MQDAQDEKENLLTMDESEMTPEMKEQKKILLDAEKAKLADLLKKGEISGLEYNKRVVELVVPEDRPKKQTMPKGQKTMTIIGAVLIVLIASIPAIMNLNWRFYFQNSLTATDGLDFSAEYPSPISEEPVQIKVDNLGETGTYKGRQTSIIYKYYYDIRGVVASVHDYWGFDDYATLVPRDVCIVWGSLSEAFLNHEAEFEQSGRYCSGKSIGSGLDPAEVFTYKTPFGQTAVSISSMTNNHLIPSTAKIRDQIFGLKAGDRVKITGYLVNIQYGNILLNSSTTREDSGNHACEVIYTTSVEKL